MEVKKLLLVAFLLIFSTRTLFSQTPCTNEEAYNKTGNWTRQGVDDLAVPDNTFPKADFPKVLAKAQKAVELIKKANPTLTGFEGRVYRQIRGSSYFSKGALPFGVRAGYFEYYCVPNIPSYPQIRGTIQLNGESGTWIEIHFNSLGWITNRDASLGKDLLTANNQMIFYLPPALTDFKATPVLAPNIRSGKNELILLVPPSKNPFVILSREDYILARKRQVNKQLTDNQQFPQMVKFLTEVNQKLDELLNKLSPAERSLPAIIKNQSLPPTDPKFFVTEKEGGRKLFTVNPDFFNSSLPRDSVQLISIYLFWDERHPAKAKLIQQFKENFDYQTLRQMLEK